MKVIGQSDLPHFFLKITQTLSHILAQFCAEKFLMYSLQCFILALNLDHDVSQQLRLLLTAENRNKTTTTDINKLLYA